MPTYQLQLASQSQGKAKGESGKSRTEGINILSFAHKVDPLIRAYRGGKPHSKFVTVVMEWGRWSPQLMTAWNTNKLLPSVIFEDRDSDTPGFKPVSNSLSLTNGRIVDVRPHVGPLAATGKLLHEYTFRFD
jgi:hypothetical protein